MKHSLIPTCKSLAYETIDVLTARKGILRTIEGEKIRFPARWMRFFPSDYEPDTFAFLRRHCRKGSIAFDLGAHMGLFTVVMARLVGTEGRVFSFEPTPAIANTLRKLINLNDCQEVVQVRSEAVSRSSGSAVFFDTGNASSFANSLVKLENHSDGLTVQTISIDEFVKQHGLGNISCLKIDVEGAELDALLGAEQTIRANSPAIHLSLHPNAISAGGGSLAEIWDFLCACNLLVKLPDREINREWFTAQNNLFDVQCVPHK